MNLPGFKAAAEEYANRPPVYALTIPELADYLEVSIQLIHKQMNAFNWQPTGERVQGGGDKYNIESIRFYKSDEKHAAALERIKGRIKQAERTAAIERQRAEDIAKLADMGITGPCPFNPEEAETNMLAYSKARPLNRALCDKYMAIEDRAGHLKGKELMTWLDKVWNKENPDSKVKYRVVIENRKRLREEGKKGLIGRLGSKKGFKKTIDEHQEYFDSLYLQEGGTPANACWRTVVGRFCDAGDISDYPVAKTFINRCKNERGESAIYLKRHGYAKWDRKYGYYVDRDYSALRPGEWQDRYSNSQRLAG